jgi:hypothetical protein
MQPSLMMSATDSAYTAALAANVTQQSALIAKPYQADMALLLAEENDADDFDMAKNDIKGLMVPSINCKNPFRYISATDNTWHPYHDTNASKTPIWESLLVATNKNSGSNAKDLEILRRVIKQTPIIKAYNQLFWSTLFLTIGLIILIYFNATSTLHYGWNLAFGVLSMLMLGSAAYNIIWGGRADGYNKWIDFKNDIMKQSNNNMPVTEIVKMLNGEKPGGNSLVQPVATQPVSTGQAMAAGAAAGLANATFGAIGNVAAGLFK